MEAFAPLLAVLVTPKTAEDRLNLRHGLRGLMAEDPTFRVEIEQGFRWARFVANSERQLAALAVRLKRDYDVEADIDGPQVVCRMGLVHWVEGIGKYAGQVGGRGHYADVKLRIGPGAPGTGCVFVSQVTDGSIPERFIAPIADGIKDALGRSLESSERAVVDLQIELYDGSYHERDSSEAAFRIAGAMAFRDAQGKATPVLREPVVHVEIVLPKRYVDGVLADLQLRGARIRSFADAAYGLTIGVHAPLTAMLGYERELNTRACGRATCTIRFHSYLAVDEPIDEGDRIASVPAPLLPRPDFRYAAIALPEPDDDSYAS